VLPVNLQIAPLGVRVTAAAARRKVNRFVLDTTSYLMGGGQPTLIETDHLIWRVPVVLAYPDQGVVGQAGFVDVDAESGNLVLAPDTIKGIKRNARALAAHLPPEATP